MVRGSKRDLLKRKADPCAQMRQEGVDNFIAVHKM